MNYKLNQTDQASEQKKGVALTAVRRLIPLLKEEKKVLGIALGAILVTAGASLIAPSIIAATIDGALLTHDFSGVVRQAGILLVVFLVGVAANYIQVLFMGGVGRRVLFNLRTSIFNKLQELPVAFFNQNKAGDLISRINNDTDKLNQFFAQALMQFISNLVLIGGTGVCMVLIDIRLALAAFIPAVVVLVVTQMLSSWVKRATVHSLQTLGGMSGEIQESLQNFKVIVAFNRLDYFRSKFSDVNEANYTASITAGIATTIFTPLYSFASTVAQLIVLAYGISLCLQGGLTIGILIGFLLYVNNFYTPLRQLASVWSSLQLALAGLDRISEVLALESNMPQRMTQTNDVSSTAALEFKDVSFAYPDGDEILHRINLKLEQGKTYALVGPTGGGKTTTATLMARLYDPTRGNVYLNGRDIRSFDPHERAAQIGFILQDPFLFSGTVKDNILYGHEEYHTYSDEQVIDLLRTTGLAGLLDRFSEGLGTVVAASGDSMSVGQKQLIAFMRATLRNPNILILDEATANIDTVTEQLLEEILTKLPPTTTRVIIAHRLNTIENADTIFFVNAGTITEAGTLEQAVEMLLHNRRGR